MSLNQLNKVRDYVNKKNLLKEGETVIAAVSGGPDSLTLLHMLRCLSSELNLNIVVAHLNHCLRPEADREEAEVEKIASRWSLTFESRVVAIRDLKKEEGISEEEAGRLARYSFLSEIAKKYNASRIALGHHLDDQAETVLLNIIRGTGVDGLAGILPKTKRGGLLLIRPLLCLKRCEIENYCWQNNLYPLTDSSNLETNYTRNKMRLELIPQLEEQYNPRVREALSGLAELAASDRYFLNNLAKKKYFEMARFGKNETNINRHKLISLSPALSSRILRIAVKKYVTSKQLGRQHVKQVFDLAESGKTGGQVTLPGGACVYLSYNDLIIMQAAFQKQEKFEEIQLNLPGKTFLPGGASITARILNVKDLVWSPSKYRAYLDYDRLPPGHLMARSRWPGAVFHPHGSAGSKKLKSFLIDQKVPFSRRDNLPLVTIQDKVLWVTGIRIAHPYRISDQTKRVLLLEYKKLRLPK